MHFPFKSGGKQARGRRSAGHPDRALLLQLDAPRQQDLTPSVSVRSGDALAGAGGRLRSEPQVGWHAPRAIACSPADSAAIIPAPDKEPVNEVRAWPMMVGALALPPGA
jgi:hypothetical protein